MKRLAFVLFVVAFAVPALAAPTAPVVDGRKPVIVWLKDQPRHEIVLAVRGRYASDIARLQARIREINLGYEPTRPVMADPGPSTMSFADISEVNRLNLAIKELLIRQRRDVNDRTELRTGPEQAAVARFIESLGGRVNYTYRIVNAVGAFVPVDAVGRLARHPLVAAVYDDHRLEPCLDVSPHAVFADSFWVNGYTGGSWYGTVMDTGVDTLNPGLTSHTFRSKTFHDVGKNDPAYADNPNTTDDLHSHGTHVSGIAWSTDASYHGMAKGADYCINAKAGWRATSGGAMYEEDGMAGADWAINTEYATAFNLSFTIDNTDVPFSRFFEAVVDDEGVPTAIAAGNGGPGAGTLTCIAWNPFVVGAMFDYNTISRSDDIVISFSSRGPCPDGRRKPDLTTPGTMIMSCYAFWEGANPDYVNGSGTSMAAPHAMASILLLENATGVSDPKVVKAVLVNTTDDWGAAGWDNAAGWGYLNLAHAYQHRADYFQDSVAAEGQVGDHRFYKGLVYGGDRTALVWNRHVEYNGPNAPTTAYDINNLDLRVYRVGDGSELYSSLQPLDNIELVAATAPDSVIVKVEAAAAQFNGVTAEPFAVATEEGFVAADPPALNVALTVPDSVLAGEEFDVSMTVANQGDVTAFGAVATLTVPEGFTLVTGANPDTLGAITPGANTIAMWTLQAPDEADTYLLPGEASSTCYRETYTGVDTAEVNVVLPNTPPGPFSLIAPAKGDTTDARPTLVWHRAVDPDDDPVTYMVTYSLDSLFNGARQTAGLTDTTFVPAESLLDSTYYWKVLASDGRGGETWSTETDWYFRVNTNLPPSAFSLAAPANGSQTERRPTFTWHRTTDPNRDAVSYTLRYSTDSGFATWTDAATGADTTCVPARDLDPVTYWWKVEARDEHGAATWSTETWTLQAVLGIAGGAKALPRTDELVLVPTVGSRGAREVRYALAHPGKVDVAIYDAAGTLVRRLVSGSQPAGYYRVTWDARGAAGVYFVRLSVAGSVLTEKLLVVR